MHQDLVRQVDETRGREPAQHLPFHHADEGILVAEVRRQRDDAGRLERIAVARPWAWGLPG